MKIVCNNNILEDFITFKKQIRRAVVALLVLPTSNIPNEENVLKILLYMMVGVGGRRVDKFVGVRQVALLN